MVLEQIVLSSSAKKEVAISSFCSSKSFLCARSPLILGFSMVVAIPFVECGWEVSLVRLETGFVYASSLLLHGSRSIPPIILEISSRHCCLLGDTSLFTGEWRSFQSLTTSGFQNASRLGRRSSDPALNGFFFEGETSFVWLPGVNVGVVGRNMGGALRGERFFVGVGELEAGQCLEVFDFSRDVLYQEWLSIIE